MYVLQCTTHPGGEGVWSGGGGSVRGGGVRQGGRRGVRAIDQPTPRTRQVHTLNFWAFFFFFHFKQYIIKNCHFSANNLFICINSGPSTRGVQTAREMHRYS